MTVTSHLRIRRLEHPTDAQIEAATQVLMDAFYDDEHTHMVLHNQHTNTSLYHEYHRIIVLDTANVAELWVAEDMDQTDETQRIVGVAGWYQPGVSFIETEEQRKAVGLEAFMESLPDDLREWWTTTYLPRVGAFSKEWVGETTEKDNWYLCTIGVLPSYQGRGAGGALFRARGEHALATGTRALWSASMPERVLLYESWGGVIRGAMVLQSMDKDKIMTLWVMELVKSRGAIPPN